MRKQLVWAMVAMTLMLATNLLASQAQGPPASKPAGMFIRSGNHWINPQQIAYVDSAPSAPGARLDVHFVGTDQVVILVGDDARRFADMLDQMPPPASPR